MKANLQNELTLLERFIAPNSGVFKLIQKIGIVLGILGAVILSADQQGVQIPALVSFLGSQASFISGLLASSIGVTAVAVSQFSVDFEAYKRKHELDNV
ncbi:hypothetical protein [Spirosoma sp.]|uniref:hypothetical protein n=1 Tax=Spirosoma sp. TaxID=1899569 RepID=UPI00262487CB|nr:hypothetical protein [Spirosoma sp.]MCX6216572.1 hypothetical protein [Spirosoma sp.]